MKTPPPLDSAQRETARVITTLSFSGDATAKGELDVRFFAPSLLELDRYIRLASLKMQGSDALIETRIKAGFVVGSFEFDVALVAMKQAIDGLVPMGNNVQSLESLINLLGMAKTFVKSKSTPVVNNLIDAMKVFRGASINKAEPTKDGTAMRVTGVSGTGNVFNQPVTVNINVFKNYQDPEIRSALRGLTRPLVVDGIDSLQVKSNEEVVNSIQKEDAIDWIRNEGHRLPSRSEGMGERTLLSIVRLPLSGGGKWEFEDKGRKFFASIEDSGFLDHHYNGHYQYKAGSLLDAELVTKEVDGKKRPVKIVRRVYGQPINST